MQTVDSSEDVVETATGVPRGLELGLRNYWYPILQSHEVADVPVAIRYLGENMVAWRDADGVVRVFPDFCPHRGIPLSIGAVVGNNLQCAFHGLQYNGAGRCAFMPWEPDDSLQLTKIWVHSYPTREIHGLVFAYLDDGTNRFPVPPLEDEIPSELFDERYPGHILTHIWDCNWLLSVDQADRFHVPFLHAKVTQPTVGGSNGTASAKAGARYGGDGRRIRVTKTETGVLDVAVLDPLGNPIYTGQRADPDFDTEGFYLPALNCLSVAAASHARPHHIYLWMVPIDETHTRVTRIVTRLAETPEQRAQWERDFREVIGPRTTQVSDEDAFVAARIIGLQFARDHEHLFFPDGEIHRRRLSLNKVFVSMQEGKRYPAVRTPL